MIRFALPAVALAAALWAQDPAPASPAGGLPATPGDSLSRVRTVYLMPMGSGLDHYLANHVSAMKVFLVTTDPQKADGVLTDQVGAGFEKRFAELYPPPKPPAEQKADKSAEKDQDKPAEKADAAAQPSKEERFSSNVWGRGKGNVYLIDVKTRAILWSIYRKPKSLTSDDLDNAAQKIAERLRDDVIGKKK